MDLIVVPSGAGTFCHEDPSAPFDRITFPALCPVDLISFPSGAGTDCQDAPLDPSVVNTLPDVSPVERTSVPSGAGTDCQDAPSLPSAVRTLPDVSPVERTSVPSTALEDGVCHDALPLPSAVRTLPDVSPVDLMFIPSAVGVDHPVVVDVKDVKTNPVAPFGFILSLVITILFTYSLYAPVDVFTSNLSSFIETNGADVWKFSLLNIAVVPLTLSFAYLYTELPIV